ARMRSCPVDIHFARRPGCVRTALLAGLAFHALAARALSAEPPTGPPRFAQREAPPLPMPEGGRRVNVSTADQLAAAVAGAIDGDVIVLADGTYRVGRPMRLDRVKNVMIRGASHDPTKVVLRGRGFDVVSNSDDILR